MKIIFGFLVVLILMIFTVYGFLMMGTPSTMEVKGQFGDMFGAINALFSGLAFLGVVYAILLQKEELGLQRKELELTRAELKRAAEAQEISGEALSKQAASLKITAKLNGLNTMLQYHTALIEINRSEKYGIHNHAEHDKHIREVTAIIEEIRTLTADK